MRPGFDGRPPGPGFAGRRGHGFGRLSEVRRVLPLAAALCATAAASAGAEGHPGARHEVPAPHEMAAPAELGFELPAAGSYELPAIDRVGDALLLADDGSRQPLLGLGAGEVAVVAFVYLSCVDAGGCPLSLASLQRLDRALAARPALGARTRLVTVSFDPARDRPEALLALRRSLAPRGHWRFLTAANAAEIEPVLADFGQHALPLAALDGAPTGLMRHVTKVFLVDAAGAVRNVYSSGFLDHRILLRDIETLIQEMPS